MQNIKALCNCKQKSKVVNIKTFNEIVHHNLDCTSSLVKSNTLFTSRQ